MIGNCPVCGKEMEVTALDCSNCDTTITGSFSRGKFSRLNEEQLKFVEVFIKSRGNIKEVEREMGISYPTVRSRLDEVVDVLQDEPGENS